jgi:NAD(P)-dependent dehydrogenase (short-subunit alcohol dehydrogenase family)
VHASVSIEADVDHLFDESDKAFGNVDVVVNNAAIVEFRPVGQISREDFYRLLDVNLLGPILVTQRALKSLVVTTPSWIIVLMLSQYDFKVTKVSIQYKPIRDHRKPPYITGTF